MIQAKLYGSQNPLAEMMLADLWAKSARAERRFLPAPHQAATSAPGQKDDTKAKAIADAVHACAGPFTAAMIRTVVPDASPRVIGVTLSRMVKSGIIAVVSKTPKDANIYEVTE